MKLPSRARSVDRISVFEERDVARLLQHLRSERSDVRVEAADRLARLRASGEELRLAVRHDSSRDVRASAALALGAARDVRAVPALLEVLRGDTDERARMFAAESLGRIGVDSAVPDLRRYASASSNWLERAYGYVALRRLGGPAVVEALISGLRDPDRRVFSACLQALNEIAPSDRGRDIASAADTMTSGLRRLRVKRLAASLARRSARPRA